MGHDLAKKGLSEEASKHFLIAAEIKDDNISTARRYRCAGTTALDKYDKIKYFKLALKFNPNNINAKSALAEIDKTITYNNRHPDGWTKGTKGSIDINALDESSFGEDSQYTLTFFTAGPDIPENKVVIIVDNKLYSNEKIISGKKHTKEISLSNGKHVISINITHTFNPKAVGMNQDARDLGVHFEIMKN